MRLAGQLIIRQASHTDLESIVAFSAAMAQETEGRKLDEARLREGTRSLLDSPAYGFFMVAEAQHADPPQLVGQLMITFEWSDWRNGLFWWIQSVYVDPAWRRQGVFRRMHNVVVSQAKANPKVCGIRLYVEQNNRTAKAVYQHVGLAQSTYKVYEKDFVLVRKGISKKHSKTRKKEDL
jgi:ribosomal protein S18 acetylase RimI-like enzyme